ncbi:AraC family transcriptional regulator [Aliikangiella coralliicola]|nr:AraC family transcriptional regulator [Aliikangiella coralliicola]
MDVFQDILNTLNLKGALYFRTDFSSPWAIKVPDLPQAARFHLVVQGQCHVSFASGEMTELAAGDLVLIPRGHSHVLANEKTHRAPSLEKVLEKSRYDGKGVLVIGNGDPDASTQMICGHYSFRQGADHPILRALPEYLVTTGTMRAKQPWLDDMLRLIVRRIFSNDVGSDAVVTRLSESVFIELLKIGIEQSERLKQILAGFNDQHISNALELIHAHPEHGWTVQSLAKKIGMSRSRFADRFNQLIGIAPMTYLGDWRIQKALSLLNDSHCSVQQVASKTGYQSPAAFTRAFTGKMGITPTKYRQNFA